MAPARPPILMRRGTDLVATINARLSEVIELVQMLAIERAKGQHEVEA